MRVPLWNLDIHCCILQWSLGHQKNTSGDSDQQLTLGLRFSSAPILVAGVLRTPYKQIGHAYNTLLVLHNPCELLVLSGCAIEQRLLLDDLAL
jgi:hypothetical protein